MTETWRGSGLLYSTPLKEIAQTGARNIATTMHKVSNGEVRSREATADRPHLVRLRNLRKDPDGSFQEATHPEGDTNMPDLAAALLGEKQRFVTQRRADAVIPFRPDHGHALLNDIERGAHPGYPLIGRLRALAEICGVIAGLQYEGT